MENEFVIYLFFLQIDGLLTIDITYPGETTRDKNFPKLRSTPKSYYINLALQANNISYAPTRFAFEFYVIQLGAEGTKLFNTKYIDDQYTPGIISISKLSSIFVFKQVYLKFGN